jgi:uncharacterized membrane protein
MTNPAPDPKNSVAPPPIGATIHIYRGLMDSAMMWRIRIDNPTNWAIVTSGTAVSFILSDPSHSHAVILLVMLFTVGILMIEARRTRYYHLWGGWLRLIETEYFVPILRDNTSSVNDAWQELLVRDLAFPHFKISLAEVVARRLRDIYLAIYLFLILAWLVKLVLHSTPDDLHCADSLWACHAAIGPIPGHFVLAAVAVFYSFLVLFTILVSRGRGVSIEVLSRSQALQQLVSPVQQPVHMMPWQKSDTLDQVRYGPSDED